jgi:hypothetical protein
MQGIKVLPHESLFLFTAPALYLFLPVEGMVDPVKDFEVDQLYGEAFFSMVGTFSILVLL